METWVSKTNSSVRPAYSRRRALMSFATLAVVALAGCSSSGTLDGTPPSEPKAQRIAVTVSASGDINPGPSGAPAPLALQIFTLRSAGRFQSMDYFDLRSQGSATMAGDIIDQRNFSIRPGETREIELNATDATALAVAGGYRDIDNAGWRSIAPVDPESAKFAVSARKASISVSRRQ